MQTFAGLRRSTLGLQCSQAGVHTHPRRARTPETRVQTAVQLFWQVVCAHAYTNASTAVRCVSMLIMCQPGHILMCCHLKLALQHHGWMLVPACSLLGSMLRASFHLSCMLEATAGGEGLQRLGEAGSPSTVVACQLSCQQDSSMTCNMPAEPFTQSCLCWHNDVACSSPAVRAGVSRR